MMNLYMWIAKSVMKKKGARQTCGQAMALCEIHTSNHTTAKSTSTTALTCPGQEARFSPSGQGWVRSNNVPDALPAAEGVPGTMVRTGRG